MPQRASAGGRRVFRRAIAPGRPVAPPSDHRDPAQEALDAIEDELLREQCSGIFDTTKHDTRKAGR